MATIRKTLVFTFLSVILIASSVRCEAQTKIKFFSTTAKDGVVPSECLKEREILLPLLMSYEHPATWTWIIACDEAAWKRVEAHMGQMNSVNGQVMASTDLEFGMTYIRGFAVLQPFTSALEAQPEHTVAHELSHIILRSHDEDVVEKRTKAVMKQRAAIQAQEKTIAVVADANHLHQ